MAAPQAAPKPRRSRRRRAAAQHTAPRPVQAGMPCCRRRRRKRGKPAAAPPSEAKAAAQAASAPDSTVPPPNPDAPVVVGVHQGTDTLRLEFPFALPTPAAAFTRADMLWLVFDTKAKIDLNALEQRGGTTIRSAALSARHRGRGDPAHPLETAATRQPRHRRAGLDGVDRRYRRGAAASARRRPQRGRPQPRQHRHSLRPSAPASM